MRSTLFPTDARVFGYGRASTKKQEASPETQKTLMKDYARYHNLPGDITFFLDQATSGKIPWEDREAGGQMFKYLRPGDHVVIAKLDRAFRSLKDCVVVLDRFEKMGIKVHIVNLMGGALDLSSPMGKFMIHVLAAFAELERAFISERTKDGLRASKKKGVRHCHYPGYGFKWEKRRVDGKTVRVRVRDEDERRVMAHIVEWRTQDEPLGWDEIAKHLKNLGIINKEGRPWTAMRIRRAFRAENILRLKEGGDAAASSWLKVAE
jgi:DNA invertase Pin-like site-specific DNA recombinase